MKPSCATVENRDLYVKPSCATIGFEVEICEPLLCNGRFRCEVCDPKLCNGGNLDRSGNEIGTKRDFKRMKREKIVGSGD